MNDMILAITRKGKAKKLMAHAREAGAPGGSVYYARGTASNTILAALGIADSAREVLTCFVDRASTDRIVDAMVESGAKGSLAVVGLEEDIVDTKWTLIEVICEEGYSEDIMAVARKAGARGGTVINAHGTSTEADVKFFGSPLVPEKEILMIVVESSSSQAVLEAIEGLEVLKQKGRAVMFTLPVKDFRTLA